MDLEYNKGILFARLRGDLSRKGSYKLNNYLVPVILKHKIKFLVYNLFELNNIDEAGLDALLNTKCAIKANKGKIYLCEVPESLNKNIRKLRIKETSNELTALDLIQV
jgi:anti-anti-sigma factor